MEHVQATGGLGELGHWFCGLKWLDCREPLPKKDVRYALYTLGVCLRNPELEPGA